MNRIVPPKKGERIELICLKCKNIFIGPNPSGINVLITPLKKMERAKCPKCGSHKIAPYPWICY